MSKRSSRNTQAPVEQAPVEEKSNVPEAVAVVDKRGETEAAAAVSPQEKAVANYELSVLSKRAPELTSLSLDELKQRQEATARDRNLTPSGSTTYATYQSYYDLIEKIIKLRGKLGAD